ncbi:heme NO-binding domain-containing protein [Vibrio mexicanus]|uniref:heme NO-binding domain-containing protein n=1 Tax=Vibrio mexicanus TaxID=1004326 RepID=UPI00063C0504|nr:heme NO-binding domain-containing protein [Vibrio mexicanus]
MKGIIFTEFMELVEQEFGLDTLDKILELAEDEGIYTSVGSYDHRDLVKLIVQLSKVTDIPPETLQQVFGKSVFKNLYQALPDTASLIHCKNTFQFVHHVEDYIHLEVKKLYPDAKPPKFEFISEHQTEMVFDYVSARCMAHVCFGLLKGCAEFYNEEIDVEMLNISDSNDRVRFAVSLRT